MDTAPMQLAASNPKKRAGRRKFRETRHPVYRGIRHRNAGKWVSLQEKVKNATAKVSHIRQVSSQICELRHPRDQSRIWLGTYPTPEMAARAHDVAAIALRGGGACLNFADSAWRLPPPASSDTKDIQRAAAEAAEMFRPVDRVEPEAAEDMYYVDEDVFGMPELVADMYNGMMLPPPVNADVAYDDVEFDVELPLWSYSI